MPEDQKSGFSEAVETGASAAHTIRGAIKTGKAISSAAKGAAAGGPYGAVAGAVWAGRKHIGKIIVAVIALLMLPVLFVLMLPGLIFGGLTNAFSPSDPEIPILNSKTAIIENANEITFTLNGILGEALDDVLARIEADFAASGADHMEVKNAYSSGPIYNANLFISQYCAAKDKDFESISLNDLAATLRENKQHLYSYTSKQEIRESTVTDPETGEETTVSETWMVYTVRYNGESYFSDVVFQLTDDQKELASDYASNLSLFLGDGLLQNLEAWTGNSITALGDVTFTDGITPVVYYNQLDERYAGKAYGTDNIGGYGCGPTAMAIVVSSLTDDMVDPVEMAEWSYNNGYWCKSSGSYHALIPAAAGEWGLPVSGCTTAEPQRITDALANGICIDGLYYAYLLVPSDGYKTQVPAGWLSLIVNAGDGIDMDMFLSRQPKETIIQKVGQQLRINRSKIKDASDTNTDFDDIDGAIRSGYFLKEGLANNEDFYYLNLLITITASNEEDLEWKVSEMKKLLLSQDMNACTCHFREEQAFLSALPLVAMEKKLYERGKRNLLTGGAASCYPFTSYEMCDDNGILLGVNKYNSSLIIVDIFNSAVYKNANMSILGTSGAGKTFTMQLMALRMRRKNIPIFIVAPLKGHEFHRACSNVGGSFIQISPASPHCINVMEIRRVDRSVNELLDGPGIQLSELAAKIQQLHIFFSLLIPDMSHEERQLLDEALVRTYNTKGITHDNASLEDPAKPGQYREMPVLGDLYEILKTSKETMRMAHILNRLVNGSASTFNKQTNVRLDNKYTVLDISSLTGDLLTVGMFVALDFVWDRAKADRTEEKAIFIDECWQLLSGAGAAGVRLAGDFLLEIAKTIRGYGGASIFASQDLADFFDLDGGRFGKGIINNSKTKIILNLEDDEAQRVQEALHLSDAETMEITHFERGHGLISTNNNNIMVEFKASPLEKDLITTDRRELREIVERKRREQSTSAEQQI